MNKVCVVIPMFNFGELTTRCIDKVVENAGLPVDILVVDDGSLVPFRDKRAKVIRQENEGFTSAVNTGINYAWSKYDYIHLLNNDTEPYPNFISELVDVFNNNDCIGVAGSTRETVVDGKKVIFTFPQDIVAGNASYHLEDLPDLFYTCAWLPFCSVLIKTEVLRQVGLLDHRMLNHCSDNDFCIRAGVMGYKTVFVPKSKVVHHGETTTRSLNIDVLHDQKKFISKIRCDYIQQVLQQYPLDSSTGLKVKLEFSLEEGGDANVCQKTG